MERSGTASRTTQETQVDISIVLDGTGQREISTGIPFFDHMLTLFSAHGFFNLTIKAKGDIEVDFHHTVEDVGLVLGDVIRNALGDRSGIKRYGYAVTPMDECLASAAVDLSNRPYLVFNTPVPAYPETGFGLSLAKEFFRALSTNAGMTLHINVLYGDNEHHVIEAMFKAVARALDAATRPDERISGPLSTKGCI
jgi:imidazoleglycerol-phosphate dehydratase